MTNPLTDQQLDDIEQRATKATPGPWEPYPSYGPTFYANTTGEHLRGVGDFNFGDGEDAEADEAFVRHAREDVDALLAEVRRQRDEILEAKAEIAKLRGLLGTENKRANAAIDREETAEQAALEAQAERDRYRAAWQSARSRAQAYGEGILRVVEDRESYQGWLKEAEARIAELERPAVEAKRNEIRQSFADLVAAAEETKDYEGAFDVQCRLREREEQWAREDAAASCASVAAVPAPQAPGGPDAAHTAARGRTGAPTDTFAAWLHHRFTASAVPWERLDDGEQSYWEHHAAAVRRAVTRGGFKTPAAVPAAVETGR